MTRDWMIWFAASLLTVSFRTDAQQGNAKAQTRDRVWVYYGLSALPTRAQNDDGTSQVPEIYDGDGLAIGFERLFAGAISAEARAHWGWDRAEYAERPPVELDRHDVELHLGVVPPIPWIQPYVAVGAGVFRTDLPPPVNSGDQPRGYWGVRRLLSAGLRISLGRRVMIRGDLRFSANDGQYYEYNFGVRESEVAIGFRF